MLGNNTDAVPGLVELIVWPWRKNDDNSMLHTDKYKTATTAVLSKGYKMQHEPKMEGFKLIRIRENSSEQ